MERRVLHILRGNERGGISNVIFSLAKNLEPLGWHSSLLLLRENSLYENAKQLGLNVKLLEKRGKLDFRLLWKVSALLKKEKYDMVHTHSIGSNLHGRLVKLLKRGEIPLVTTVHADTLSILKGTFKSYAMSYLVHYFDLSMAVLSDRVLAVSNALGKRLISKGIPKTKVVAIHNGIDHALINKEKGTDIHIAQAEFGLSPEEKIIGTVGRLIPVKNHDIFIRAAKDVVERGNKVKFLIVGDGQLEKRLKKTTVDLNLHGRVIFTGWRTDLHNLYHLMDIFVLASSAEGFPITLLEAMAHNKPVIATDVGGIPEALQHGKTGLLVPPGDSTALSTAIMDLLADPLLCRSMGKAGGEIVKDKFTVEKMAKKTVAVYEELIRDHTPRKIP